MFAVHFELRSATMRFVLAGLVCLGCATFAYETWRVCWAAEQISNVDMRRVQRAVTLDGGNAALHDWAGLVAMYGEPMNPEVSVRALRKATELSPRVAEYWGDLARACFVASDMACAKSAYARALATAPFDARMLRQAAMFELAVGDRDAALSDLRQLVRLEPSNANSALAVALRTIPAEMLWQSAVREQENVAVKVRFLDLLNTPETHAVAQGCWQEIAGSSPRLSLEDVKPHLESLERQHRYEDLAIVWRDLERLRAAGMPIHSDGNPVVNASFTQLPSGVGLDWRFTREPFVETQVVATDRGTALQLDFTVANNLEYEPVSQLVPVDPGKKYEVRGLVRSEEITSDSGPRVRVTDALCTQCLDVSSDGETGTTTWHELRVGFETPSTTHTVRISIYRPRSRSFPFDIKGRFWLREASLRAVE